MNTLGLSMLFKLGCLCSRDYVLFNNCKYYVLEELGQGGFGTVFLVENSRTRKRFAVKKLVCHSRQDQENALQEVDYHTKVEHPNIIPCLESSVTGCADPILNSTSQVLLLLPYYSYYNITAGEVVGVLWEFFVMYDQLLFGDQHYSITAGEYTAATESFLQEVVVGRGTLSYLLETLSRSRQYIDEAEVLRVFLQICDGIKALHDAAPVPLAHRDIKPDNILLDVDNTPIIMDLGSVAPALVQVRGTVEAQRLQDQAAEKCSITFRAPELFNVESYCVIDQRTDIWSLGCLLYAMCYFKSPFDAVYERGDSVALAVISAAVEFPTVTPFSKDTHHLIASMLRVPPLERPYVQAVIERAQSILKKLGGIL